MEGYNHPGVESGGKIKLDYIHYLIHPNLQSWKWEILKFPNSIPLRNDCNYQLPFNPKGKPLYFPFQTNIINTHSTTHFP